MKQNELQRRRRYRATAARLTTLQSASSRGFGRNARASERRGVLLLVVLSVLILFMLVGTTFLLTSNQYKTAAKIMDKANRTTFQPEDVLERALMQLVRDTNNRHSALRYHSLLRDLYGGDGFVGQVNTAALPSYAEVTATSPDALGTTGGELVDIWVTDSNGGVLDDDNVVGLDLDTNGLPLEYSLSSNSAYYNGCLLTMMEGPCRGVSVRVVDYDYRVDLAAGRLRVVAPSRLDGQPLTIESNFSLSDFYDANSGIGYRFMVNGRPFNGTGVGYNALANTGAPRLTAYEAIRDLATQSVVQYGEVGLFPNSTYFTPSYAGIINNLYYLPNENANLTQEVDALNVRTNSLTYDHDSDGSTPEIPNSLYAPYGRFSGPGDTDESYDAPDFQNMFLAHQALRPRFRGRVVDAGGVSLDPAAYDPTSDAPQRLDLDGITIPSLHRPALANFWFHRLFNSAWLSSLGDQQRVAAILDPFGQLGNTPEANQIAAIKRKFSMRPLREDHPDFNGSNSLSENGLASRFINNVNTNGEITTPFWEAIGPWDVDNDGDGIPDSVWVDLGLPVQKTEDGRFYKPLVAMLVEDLDGRLNLNAHGSAEHFANASLDQSNVAGNLAQDYNNLRSLQSSNQLPQGSGWGPADISLRSILSPNLPLYDSTIVGDAQYDDYSRLLVGRPSPEDPGRNVSRAVNLSVDFGRYGSFPAENNMGRMLYAPGRTFNATNLTTIGTTREQRVPFDFAGYPQFAGELYSASAFGERPDLNSRYATGVSATGQPVFEPTTDFIYNPNRSLLDDSPYEVNLSEGARRGVPADIQTIVDSYSTNNPINEDALFSVAELERILRAPDADASDLPDRLWNLVDAFNPEKLAVQQDIVNGIDITDRDNFGNFNPSSLQRVIAQSQAAINRRLVTTDSYDLPVPNENWTTRLLFGADGLPGVPQYDTDGDGNLEVDEPGDDNGDTIFDDGAELGQGSYDPADGNPNNDSDDYQVVMGGLPPSGARITDYLRYRVTLELLKQGVTPTATQINQIIHGDDTVDASIVSSDYASFGGLLSPEVLAGHKMNVNRPIGDGRDNNGNGVVDEPAEAGEPYTYDPSSGNVVVFRSQDLNGNGVLDQDIDNDGVLYFDSDGDLVPDTFDEDDLIRQDRNLNGTLDPDERAEPIVDYTWIDSNGDGFRDANEFHPFGHALGKDVNGRGATGGGYMVADDAPLARQLLARHLYCLMLAVMDENYIAPYDSNDPQVLHYINPNSKGSVAFQIKESLTNSPPTNYPWPGYRPFPPSATPNQIEETNATNAKRMALRKLTCRQVAQWAINCVDLRDSDSIQTPFEYDENPWDGWNVIDTTNGVYYAIDGDLTTNENYAMRRDLSTGAIGPPTIIAQADVDNPVIPISLQTRGVVWGAERPELLMTEGIAWHDRRVEDLQLGELQGPDTDDYGQVSSSEAEILDQKADNDMDQKFKPAGRCYVELFNPWSSDSLLAAELYRDPGNQFRRYDTNDDGEIIYSIGSPDAQIEGLLLDRVSDGQSMAGLPSPVWRMACTETHPLIRNTTVPSTPLAQSIQLNDDPFTDASNDGNGGTYLGLTIDNGPWAYQSDTVRNISGTGVGVDVLPDAYLNYYARTLQQMEDLLQGSQNSWSEAAPRPTDPDFPSFDRLQQPEEVAFKQIAMSNPGLGSTGNADRHILLKPNDYLERLFYFTGAPSVDDVGRVGIVRDGINNSGVHIPEIFYDVKMQGTARTSLQVENNQKLTNKVATRKIDLEDDGLQYINGDLRVHISRFVALDYFDTDGDSPTDDHVLGEDPAVRGDGELEPLSLAPILPGRFAVIGTAGEVYGKKQTSYDTRSTNPNEISIYPTSEDFSNNLQDRYTTIITQSTAGLSSGATTATGASVQAGFRRVEMIPSTNPFRQQFIFRMNGGLSGFEGLDEYPRTGEVVDLTPEIENNDPLVNVTDPIQFSAGATPVIQPVVAIPVEGFNISEPLDGYLVRQLEIDPGLEQYFYRDPRFLNSPDFPAEGTYTTTLSAGKPSGYDEPFDLLPELIENQTTPNYRTMHLQRLANPLLAWNPPPVDGGGKVNDQHDSARPVNPYLTTDSLSLDLTSLNSTSSAENVLLNDPALPAEGPEVRHQVKRNQLPNQSGAGIGALRANTKITLQSQERGLHGTVSGSGDPMPNRMLWNQDRPTGTSEIIFNDGVALKPQFKISPRLDEYSFGTDETLSGISYREGIFDYPVRHSLGLMNRGYGKFYNFDSIVGAVPSAYDVDINGDDADNDKLHDITGQPSYGDLIGAQELDSSNTLTVDDEVTPVFHWPNRPFISESEVMLAPIWGSSRMLTYYSIYNPDLTEQPNQYDGTAKVDSNGDTVPYDELARGDAEMTNDERWERMHTTYGHLPNFLATAGEASKIAVNSDGDVVAYGAPHFYRILDYLHVPSRFIATDRLLTPERFTTIPANVNDPRRELAAPFNRVDNYREPGRVNLNTVVGRGDDSTNGGVLIDPADRWSEVYDGLMHRRQDANILDGNNLISMGHLGPAWRDIEKSRRGYLRSDYGFSTGLLNHSPLTLNANFPTFFANPFRSPGEGSNVPLAAMQQLGVGTGLLRAHHFSPGNDSAWGNRDEDIGNATKIWGVDDQIADDASEAYAGLDNLVVTDDSDDSVAFRSTPAFNPNVTANTVPGLREAIPSLFYDPRVDPITGAAIPDTADSVVQPRIPLMIGAALEPSLDTERNPHLRYQPMTRLANLTSTRSGVFAVWMTVGFFEVSQASELPGIKGNGAQPGRYMDENGNFNSAAAEDLFFRIYPDGYTLGREIGLDTGENQRHRGFYIVDRTLPVAFKPGEDLNVDKAVLLRRRIE